MANNESELSDGEAMSGRAYLSRLAWLPIPLLLVTIIVLWAADLRTAHESPFLLAILNLVFSMLIPLLVACLVGRSFLCRGTPGLLMLGCGVVLWGCAAMVVVIAALVATGGTPLNMQAIAPIHNLCVWLSAACHLGGAILSMRSGRTLRRRGLWLDSGYALALGVAGLLTLATFAGWLPIFFHQGEGGTLVRQLVLGSAIAMFALTAVLLWEQNRPLPSPFAYWYTLALLLIAAGLFGILNEKVHASSLSWTGRAAVYLSGVYMLAAAVASMREPATRTISLGQPSREARYPYGMAITLVLAATAVRLAFLTALGTHVAFITFYPAVMLAALYGGLRAGMLAMVLSAILADYFWIEPTWSLSGTSPVDWLSMAVFILSCTMISWITEAMRHAQTRAVRAEAETRVATERVQAAETLRESEHFKQAVLDSLPAHIAVLDHDGRIVAVNASWRRFARENGHPGDQGIAAGADYVQVCRRAIAAGDLLARDALEGIEAVLSGSRQQFVLEYPCHSPARQRWFLMHVVPAPSALGHAANATQRRGAVITHLDISQRKQAEDAVRESETMYRSLFGHMLDGFAYCQMLYDDQGRPDDFIYLEVNDAFARLTNLENVTGKRVTQVVPGIRGAHPELFEIYGRVAQTGRSERFEIDFRPLNRWLSVSVYSPARNYFVAVFDNISDRKHAEETLRASEQRLKRSQEIAHLGSWELDLQADRLTWSDEVYRIFGLQPQEFGATYQAFLERVHPDDRAAVDAAYGSSVREGRSMYEIEHRVLRQPGDEIRWVSERCFHIRDASGQIIRSTGMVLDITDRKRMEESLREAKATAEAASNAKDHFLAVLSHELRNPLNPVLATATMLHKDPRFDADIREQLEVICRNAELEARLIDDLLDVTRIARGKIELERRPIELCTVIRRAAEVCMPDIGARKLKFGVDLGPVPYWVDADAARLQQVFWNLINNAVKFTPLAGCVEIRCRHDADAHVVVEVTDNGKGIEPDMLPRLFDAFEQGERHTTRQFGGLGLGLTISRTLVELHGGTLTAGSQGKGKGATFTVRLPMLPIGAAVPIAATNPNAPLPAMPARSLRILLVEDHGDTAVIMKRLLAADGHQVETATDVATALKLVQNQTFDLLLSDLGLPDGSGLDLIRAIRHSGSKLPGIALSGYGQEQDVQQSHDAGFVIHLVKPVSLPKLAEAITRAVGDSAGVAVTIT